MLELRLKEILEERGLTQLEVAFMTHIAPVTICELVNNKRISVNKKQIAKICKALEITDLNEIFKVS